MNITDILTFEIKKVIESKNRASKLISTHNLQLPQDEIGFAASVLVCETTLETFMINAELLDALNEILDVIQSGETSGTIKLVVRQKRDDFAKTAEQYKLVADSIRERVSNINSPQKLDDVTFNYFDNAVQSNETKAGFYRDTDNIFMELIKCLP